MRNNIVSQVSDMDYDEVTLTRAGMNRHADIVIAKSLFTQEDRMGKKLSKSAATAQLDEDVVTAVFDADGNPVNAEDLETGDVIYSESGEEFVWIQDGDSVEDALEGADESLEEVGKSRANLAKSFSQSVLTDLSKALNDDARQEVLSKAFGQVFELVDEAVEVAKSAHETASVEREIRESQEWIAKAATYNVPIPADELGEILKTMSEHLSDEQLAAVDQMLVSTGEALYQERGFIGKSQASPLLDLIGSAANEMLSKSQGTMTSEQAMVGLLDANPEAYDALLNDRD